MKKYRLSIIVGNIDTGRRLKRRASIDIKRLGRTIKSQSESTVLLPRGRYRLIGKAINISGVWYKPTKKPFRLQLKRNRTVWVWYERQPMGESPVPPEFVEMYNAINRVRAEHAAKPLKYQDRLGFVAQQHANDIAEHESASHLSSNGDTFEQRVEKSAYQGDPAGEIIATGTVGIDGTINAWKHSPHHFEAMINPLFDHIGIGFVNKTYEGYSRPTAFWVVNFGYDPAL